MSPETISDGQAASAERYRARRPPELEGDASPANGTPYEPAYEPAPAYQPGTAYEQTSPYEQAPAYQSAPEKPRLPSLDLEMPTAPDFTAKHWLETSAGTLADHPLLRGLLLELPPKGSTPPPDWLDRWFEATRSILELLYVRQPPSSR